MKRKGNLSECIGTTATMEAAFWKYSDGKLRRDKVKDYRKQLAANSERLAQQFRDGTWRTSEYIKSKIYKTKVRIISKLPVEDHVIQWAVLLYIEKLLCDTYVRNSFSCVKGRGTHDFLHVFYHDLHTDAENSVYAVQLDAHHYFENIMWFLVMDVLERKIKDKHLLAFLKEFSMSHTQGLPLGVKISQILANFLLYRFDHDAMECFHIADDPDKYRYWRSRFIADKIATARTAAEKSVVALGERHLGAMFDAYVRDGMRNKYYRFADNMIMRHRDKTFLHLMSELAIMILARDFYIKVNKDWNVRPVRDGIDICGYVFFNSHIRLRKRNKQALCREVAKLRKQGKTPEEIRLRCASRIGFAMHADCRNLMRKLNVNMEERLGKKIRERKRQPPFAGMRAEQSRHISDIICPLSCNDEGRYLILLEDYAVMDSKVKKGEKMIAIRYKRIVGKTPAGDSIFEQQPDKTTGQMVDCEYYSYSGSTILINTADLDFSRDDLPAQTVIKELTNKFGKKYLKFT